MHDFDDDLDYLKPLLDLGDDDDLGRVSFLDSEDDFTDDRNRQRRKRGIEDNSSGSFEKDEHDNLYISYYIEPEDKVFEDVANSPETDPSTISAPPKKEKKKKKAKRNMHKDIAARTKICLSDELSEYFPSKVTKHIEKKIKEILDNNASKEKSYARKGLKKLEKSKDIFPNEYISTNRKRASLSQIFKKLDRILELEQKRVVDWRSRRSRGKGSSSESFQNTLEKFAEPIKSYLLTRFKLKLTKNTQHKKRPSGKKISHQPRQLRHRRPRKKRNENISDQSNNLGFFSSEEKGITPVKAPTNSRKRKLNQNEQLGMQPRKKRVKK